MVSILGLQTTIEGVFDQQQRLEQFYRKTPYFELLSAEEARQRYLRGPLRAAATGSNQYPLKTIYVGRPSF